MKGFKVFAAVAIAVSLSATAFAENDKEMKVGT